MCGMGGVGASAPITTPATAGSQASVAGATGGGTTAAATAALPADGAQLGPLLLQLTTALQALTQALSGTGAIGGGPGTPSPVTTPPADTPPTEAPPKAEGGGKVDTPPGKEAKTYTVKQGDTLSKIAREHGIAKWQDLYELNKDVIGGDPNKIKPGQVLKLPDGATPVQGGGQGGETPPRPGRRNRGRGNGNGNGNDTRTPAPNPNPAPNPAPGLTEAQKTALRNERTTLEGERDRLISQLTLNGGRIGTTSAVNRLEAVKARIAQISRELEG